MVALVTISVAAANAEADAFAKLLDGGFIDIFDGVQPKSPDEALTGQRLGVTLAFGSPAFRQAKDGSVTSNPIESGVAKLSLNPATWARFYRANHTTAVMDVSVGVRDAAIILPSVNLPKGILVSCSSFTHVISRAVA